MFALCLPVFVALEDPRPHLARLVLSIVGVGHDPLSDHRRLFVIKAICLWCSSVHLTTFVLFVVVVTTSPVVLPPGRARPKVCGES